MKKSLFLIMALSLGMFVVACGGDTKKGGDVKDAPEAAQTEEVDAEAEEAVQAYEAWLVKYDSLYTLSEKGEDVTDQILDLQTNTVFEVSEKLMKTESKRNADQQARVKAVEEKAEAIKQKILNN